VIALVMQNRCKSRRGSHRQCPTERQMKYAEFLVDGLTKYQAAIKAGFPPSTAKNMGYVYKRSWGLRTAIEWAYKARRDQFNKVPREVSSRRYLRRAVARDRGLIASMPSKARSVEVPRLCHFCGGDLEGLDNWCVTCRKIGY
jgi:hypothetical protein